MIKLLPSKSMQFVYLALGAGFLVLGLVGLVFPLIPGVLFLVAAIYLFGKVSVRVRNWSQSSSTYTGMERRMALLGGVNGWQRVQLAALMTIDAVVRGVDTVVARVGKIIKNRP